MTKSVTGPVLYLDYDGVLHPDTAYHSQARGVYLRGEGELFMHAPDLEQALAPFPAVRIVLSTSWVCALRFSQARKRLPEGLQSRVVGSTFHGKHTSAWDRQTRYQQNYSDVARRNVGANWLALDDDDERWAPQNRHHLVHVQGYTGLQPEDLDVLCRRLTELGAVAALERAHHEELPKRVQPPAPYRDPFVGWSEEASGAVSRRMGLARSTQQQRMFLDPA